ncbi:MAG: hypothetical protein K2O32_00945 [Acetatifactor sp.]|nr:hypothetical protein [Acetatifactor sp.]
MSGMSRMNESNRQSMQYKADAYLTIYLTLSMTVILSLFLVLIEGVRKNAVFMESECVTDIGLNSILGEYHRELLAQYNLFAIDSSYGSALPRVDATRQHLQEYIEHNLSTEDVFLDWLFYRDFLGIKVDEVQIGKVLFLTDDAGSVFRRRAAEAVWDDLNLDLYRQLQNWMQVVDSEQLTERDIAEEKRKLDKQLDAYDGDEVQISETEWITVEIVNPTAALEKKRKEGILKWVIKDTSTLSNKTLPMNNLIMMRMSARKINQGNIKMEELSETEEALERFFFQEYLLRYMGHYGAESEKATLCYQIEYLLAGGENDLVNLKSVVNTIFAMREVANTSYIMGDQEKCLAAETLGSLLAIAMTVPEASELIKMILLFGWAFAESIHDVECLLAGERVPLIKTSKTWFYDLDKALKLGNPGGHLSSSGDFLGLSYEDYLRILMMLQNKDTITARAMNMVEADIRQTSGNEQFRLDGCLDTVEACVEIKSVYGHTCQITRRKGYSTQ